MLYSTFFIVAIITVLQRTVVGVCPAAYTDLGTGCYRFTIQEDITWDQAYFICKLELNGYLVEIQSEQEQNNLAVYIKAVIDPEGANFWWVGASDVLEEGVYRYMTSGAEVTYAPWEKNEPNNDGDNENCVELRENLYVWNDKNCNSREHNIGAICETKPIE